MKNIPQNGTPNCIIISDNIYTIELLQFWQ